MLFHGFDNNYHSISQSDFYFFFNGATKFVFQFLGEKRFHNEHGKCCNILHVKLF